MSDVLTGKWFHSYENGEICWQGHILGLMPGSGSRYLVQLCSWIDGAPSNQQVVNADDMQDWRFYDAAEDMNCAWEKQNPRRK